MVNKWIIIMMIVTIIINREKVTSWFSEQDERFSLQATCCFTEWTSWRFRGPQTKRAESFQIKRKWWKWNQLWTIKVINKIWDCNRSSSKPWPLTSARAGSKRSPSPSLGEADPQDPDTRISLSVKMALLDLPITSSWKWVLTHMTSSVTMAP